MLSLSSVSAIHCLFRSDTFLHMMVSWCLLMSARHGTSMSHREHLGCGRFPSSKMIMMSRICRLQKCICIAVHEPALPGQPSTGQLLGPPLVRKATRYVRLSPPVAEASQIHCSSFYFLCASSGGMPATLPLSPPAFPALDRLLLLLPLSRLLPRYLPFIRCL